MAVVDTAERTTADDRAGEAASHVGDPADLASANGRSHRHWALAAVLVALLVGVVLRGLMAHAGLPYLHDHDEPMPARTGAQMAIERDVNPHYFKYPALVFDTVAVTVFAFVDSDTPYGLSDFPIAKQQTPANSVTERPRVFALLRWTTGVLPGLVAVASAGAVVWLASRRWWAAGLASGLVALNPLDLDYGRYVLPNSLAGATSGLVVLGSVWLLTKPTLTRYLLTGAAIGLAGAAKYNAVLAGLALVTAHVLAMDWSDWRTALRRSWMLLPAAAAAGLAFAATNPGALADPYVFREGVEFEREHYRVGHAGNEGDALGFHLSALWRAGGPLLLLMPFGLVARSRQVRRAVLVTASFAVPYVAFISSFTTRFARNLLPVSVPIAALAALGLVAVVEHVVARSRRTDERADGEQADATAIHPAPRTSKLTTLASGRLGAATLACVCLAALVWPAAQARATVDKYVPDPWEPAREWIESHVPPGGRIAVDSYGVYVHPGRYQVHAPNVVVAEGHDAEWYRANDYALIVVSERQYQRYFDDPDPVPWVAERAEAYARLLDETCTRFATGPENERVLLLDPSC